MVSFGSLRGQDIIRVFDGEAAQRLLSACERTVGACETDVSLRIGESKRLVLYYPPVGEDDI